MTEKNLLVELRDRISRGEISVNEVLMALGIEPDQSASGSTRQPWPLATILYYLGGAVVFMGLGFLVSQEWHAFGPMVRIMVTLGSAIGALTSAVLLNAHPRLGGAGGAFFLLSALLMPIGLFVTYDESAVSLSEMALQFQISAILSLVYLALFLLFRKTLLLVFAIVFTTALYFVSVDALVGAAPVLDAFKLSNYQILIAGLSYLFLGHSLAVGSHHSLCPWLYSFGLAGFLGAALVLGGWKPDQNPFWELVYPGLVFVIIFLSTFLRSRAFLIFGSLALGSYLSKITIEYFSDSLGWAFALVLVGFLLMGVAYLALRIQRRYLNVQHSSVQHSLALPHMPLQ